LAEKLKQKYLLLEDHITLEFKPYGKTSFEENKQLELLNIDNNISNEQYFNSNAMIIYTSGSTGPPKGSQNVFKYIIFLCVVARVLM